MKLQKAFSSSIGTKFLIAFTGLSLFLFLIAHLAGNLLFLAGPEAFNGYAHKLTSNPLILIAEGGLVVVFLAHVLKSLTMFMANRGARPARYATTKWARTKNDKSRKTLSSATMIVSGTVTLLFVVTHLATFKFGPAYPGPDGVRDLYRLQLEVFRQPGYVLFYLACMGVIFSHLWHGISSAVQSFGIDSPRWTPGIIWTSRVLAAGIAGGFFILPILTFFTGR